MNYKSFIISSSLIFIWFLSLFLAATKSSIAAASSSSSSSSSVAATDKNANNDNINNKNDNTRRREETAATTATAETTTTQSSVCPEGTKQLYVFIGPHRSAASSVEEFFMKAARGITAVDDSKKTRALQNVRWPLVYGTHSNQTYPEKIYKRFNHLIDTPNNKQLRAEIIDAIHRDYSLPRVDKIIFGGEEFDQVKPFSPYDSVQAVRDVVDHLGVPSNDCVTIIINYRFPRFKHWISMYNNLNYKPGATKAGEDIENDDETTIDHTIRSYEEHMCSETELDRTMRIRELGTTMNPMYLSKTFLDENYKVQLIDMSSIGIGGKGGYQITHAIACDILGGKCHEKWLDGHAGELMYNNQIKTETKIEQQLIDDAERLFLYRDCSYKNELESNKNFNLLHRDKAWEDCQLADRTLTRVYKSLQRGVVLKNFESIDDEGNAESRLDFDDSDGIGNVEDGNRLLFEALLSQLECGGAEKSSKGSDEVALSIEDVLSGKYVRDVILSKAGSSSSGGGGGGSKMKAIVTKIEDVIEDVFEDVIEDVTHPSSSNTWALVGIGIFIGCCGCLSLRCCMKILECRRRRRRLRFGHGRGTVRYRRVQLPPNNRYYETEMIKQRRPFKDELPEYDDDEYSIEDDEDDDDFHDDYNDHENRNGLSSMSKSSFVRQRRPPPPPSSSSETPSSSSWFSRKSETTSQPRHEEKEKEQKQEQKQEQPPPVRKSGGLSGWFRFGRKQQENKDSITNGDSSDLNGGDIVPNGHNNKASYSDNIKENGNSSYSDNIINENNGFDDYDDYNDEDDDDDHEFDDTEVIDFSDDTEMIDFSDNNYNNDTISKGSDDVIDI